MRSVFCSYGGGAGDGGDGGDGGVGDDGYDGGDAVDEHTKAERSKPNSYITSLLPPHQCFCHQVYTYYTNVSDFSML